MLKQILCCSLLVGQLCAGEHPRPPLPSGMNAAEVSAAFMKRFPGVPTELPAIRKESSSSSVSDAQSADQTPTVSEGRDRRKAPKFTGAEDAGIGQYLKEHPGKRDWEGCLQWLEGQGIIAPGARTARQISVRYNTYLKTADERGKLAPRFTPEEDEALKQIVQEYPELSWEERAKLFAEKGVSNQGVQRTAKQLMLRYNCGLKSADERGKLASRFTDAEDAGIMQYVQDHPGRQNWDECLKTLTERGIIAPGARTARQISVRYNGYLKGADERKKLAPKFTAEEDEVLIQIVREHPDLSWEDTAKLFAERMAGKCNVSRSPMQLKGRYNKNLKGAGGRGKLAPKFTAEEDEALIQIVHENPELGWEERAELFAEAGVSDPAVQRSAKQLQTRYNHYLKDTDERRKIAPDFSDAEDAGIMQYVQTHRGRQNWDECLKALTEQGIIAPGARTAKQLQGRYHNSLRYRLGEESDSASEEEESL